MIQWKQRLYAFLLRRIVGPFLDDKSKGKLHESIQVSFQEGKFAVQDVALSTDYLETLNEKFAAAQQQSDDNSDSKPTLKITKVRIEKLQIHLSLLDGDSSNNTKNSTNNRSRSSSTCSSNGSDEHEGNTKNEDDDNGNKKKKNLTNATSSAQEESIATTTTSLAWRALQLGSRAAIGEVLALFAEVQISGVYVQVEPLSPSLSSLSTTNTTTKTEKPSQTAAMATDTDAPNGIMSSYVDAALSSLRLSLNINDLRIRVMSPTDETGSVASNTPTTTATTTTMSDRHFIELRLSSASYRDAECTRDNLDKSSSSSAAFYSSSSSSYQTILHKVVQFSTISILTGQQHQEEKQQEQILLLSTIAMIDGKGEISVRAIEYSDSTSNHYDNSNDSKAKTRTQQPKQVQQDIEVKLNQQIKVSVDELSLKQIQKVVKGFQQQNQEQQQQRQTGTNTGEYVDQNKNTDLNINDCTQVSNNIESDTNENEKDQHELTGIMKQYRLARHLAERNEVRGGIIVPASAYADNPKIISTSRKDDDDFDIFFDANDKSFHHYSSILQGSFMMSPARANNRNKKNDENKKQGHTGATVGYSSDFFHTKIRLHIVGGGIKLSFRRTNRGTTAELPSLLMPDEYILLTFSDMNLTSSVSSTTSDHTFTISHLEIDDSQLLLSSKGDNNNVNESNNNSNKTNKRQIAEIGNILRFSSPAGNDNHGEALLQPPCISIHTSVRKDFSENGDGQTSTDVELDLEPIQLTYRHGSVSSLITLQKNLNEGEEKNHQQQQNENKRQTLSKKILQEKIFQLQCNCASITLTFPILDGGKNDYSTLYGRCGQLVDMSSLSLSTPVSSTMTSLSSLGIVIDSISLLYKYEENIKFEDLSTNSDVSSKLELDHILVFASTPATRGGVGCGGGSLLRRNILRTDILTISGLADIQPCIPVSIEYQQLQQRQQQDQKKQQISRQSYNFSNGAKYNISNSGGFGAAAAAAMEGRIGGLGTIGEHSVKNNCHFPVYPTISSFKARQEDEDEDLEIDRILSEKIRDVGIDSRVGLRGQDPQDSMLEVASNCGSLFRVHIPEVYGDLSKNELLILNQMLQDIVIPDAVSTPAPAPDTIVSVPCINASKKQSCLSQNEVSSSLVGVALTCDRIMLSIHNYVPANNNEVKYYNNSGHKWFSYSLRMDHLNVHSVLMSGSENAGRGSNGDTTISDTSNLRQLRFCTHEANIFEAEDLVIDQLQQKLLPSSSISVRNRVLKLKERNIRNGQTSAVPIIFRSKLFSPISRENPSILFDMMNEKEEERTHDNNNSSVQRKKVYLTLYNMTYRYDIDSNCVKRLADLFQQEEQQDRPHQEDQQKQQLHSCEAPRVTRIFVSVADCNVDYSSSKLFKTASRTIVRVGDLRISSNVMHPAARVQAFSLSIGDVSTYLCPTRHSHNFENFHIAGAELLMKPEELSNPSSLLVKKNSKKTANAISVASDIVLKEMDYRIILTLDSMDAIIAVSKPSSSTQKQQEEKTSFPSSPSSSSSSSSPPSWSSPSSSRQTLSFEPHITTSLTFGELSIYACKDSFKCFSGTITDLQTKLTALDDQGLEELRTKSTATFIRSEEKYEQQPSSMVNSLQSDDSNDDSKRQDVERELGLRAAAVSMQSQGSGSELHNLSSLTAEGNQVPQSRIKAEEQMDDFQLDGYDWTTIDHNPSQNSEATCTGTDIPPGEEQVARWYSNATSTPFTPLSDSISGLSSLPENQHITGFPAASFASQEISLEDEEEEVSTEMSMPTRNGTKAGSIRLITQHFPLQVVSNPFGDNDSSAAKLAGTKLPPAVQNRILVHDLRVKLRFFDGYDWPAFLDQKKRKASFNNKGLSFIIDNPPTQEEAEETKKAEDANDGRQRRDQEDNRAKLMGELLGGNDEHILSPTFQDCPLPEERGAALLEQSEIRRLSRRANRYLQISISGVRLKLDGYQECIREHRLSSCMDLSVMDLFIAETISNENPKKMMGEWVNDLEHPRDTRDGFLMMKMVTWNPATRVTAENSVANDEAEVLMRLLPMRCILDQRAIRFARLFFGSDDEEKNAVESWSARLHKIPPPIFRSFCTKPCKLKIDYKPQKLDFKALKNGCMVELINLSPLDGMVLTLQQVDIEDAEGFGAVISNLAGGWLRDICATQMHKFLSNSRPFEPITRISGGVADLFVLPWDAYKNGDSVNRALRSSLSSLAGTVTYETLTNTSRITGYIAGKMAQVSAGSLSPAISHYDPLPSRPIETPKRVGDASRHALESLARGVQTANYKIVVIPFREYRRKGATGAVTSMLKGIPVAVVAPVSGATEALSYTLLSARNQILPEVRKEEEAIRRGLHFDG